MRSVIPDGNTSEESVSILAAFEAADVVKTQESLDDNAGKQKSYQYFSF